MNENESKDDEVRWPRMQCKCAWANPRAILTQINQPSSKFSFLKFAKNTNFYGHFSCRTVQNSGFLNLQWKVDIFERLFWPKWRIFSISGNWMEKLVIGIFFCLCFVKFQQYGHISDFKCWVWKTGGENMFNVDQKKKNFCLFNGVEGSFKKHVLYRFKHYKLY